MARTTAKTKTTAAPEQAPVAVEDHGPFVHQLQLYLVGGQNFTLNEVTSSTKMPANVVAFINAWREKKDVWHSPNNDPRFGVRVKDVSLYDRSRARRGTGQGRTEEVIRFVFGGSPPKGRTLIVFGGLPPESFGAVRRPHRVRGTESV